MKPDEFISQLHQDEIVAAIREAEKLTSGEIRVFISRNKVENPVKAAESQFERLGMSSTKNRNGVLIFVAPESRNFAVVGDTGIHERCGPGFWIHLAEEMTNCFKQAEFSTGLAKVIAETGQLLAKHFPRQSDDKNELPDSIEGD